MTFRSWRSYVVNSDELTWTDELTCPGRALQDELSSTGPDDLYRTRSADLYRMRYADLYRMRSTDLCCMRSADLYCMRSVDLCWTTFMADLSPI